MTWAASGFAEVYTLAAFNTSLQDAAARPSSTQRLDTVVYHALLPDAFKCSQLQVAIPLQVLLGNISLPCVSIYVWTHTSPTGFSPGRSMMST